MKLTKKLEADVLSAYQELWNANISGDMKTFSSYLDDNVVIYGTAEAEVFNSKKEAIRFYEATADQMTGKADFRNRRISTKAVGDAIVINEQCDLYVLAGEEWIFYGHVRVTAMFIKKGNAWKIIQMHGSFPDSRTEEGEQIAADKVKAENLQLREAVRRRTVELEEKNRELEIESALEKVRSVAMGMKSPQDMLMICTVISQQLAKLGLKDIRTVQTAIFYPDRGTYLNYEYYARQDKGFATEVDYKSHKIQLAFARKMMKGPNEEVREHLKGRKLLEWFNYQKTSNQFTDAYLQTAGSLCYCWFSLGWVALGISTFAPLTPEEITLFKRFMNVFELAYQRYLDIEKALQQSREAQIEVALERVRSKTMAMHNSHEVGESVAMLFDELSGLGVLGPSDRCGIGIMQPQYVMEAWTAAKTGAAKAELTIGHLNMTLHPLLKAAYKGWDDKKEIHQYILEGEDKKAYSEAIRNQANYRIRRDNFMDAERIVHSDFYFREGCLYVFSHKDLSAESIAVFSRFATVFGQTYRRYQDLRKAEAQAREAQIEAAMEKIRSRSLAMHLSNEIREVVAVVFAQLNALAVKTDTIAIQLFDFASKSSVFWPGNTLQSEAPEVRLPYDAQIMKEDTCHRDLWMAMESGKIIFNKVYSREQKDRWFQYVFEHNDSSVIHEHARQFILQADKHIVCFVPQKHSAVFADSWDGRNFSDEDLEIFKRVAVVFDQAYIRFLDLQKAEAQAREARIEAALESVRSKAMTMRTSEDIADTTAASFEELKKIGIISFRSGVGLLTKGSREALVFADSRSAEGRLTALATIRNMDDHPALQQQYEAWEQQKDYEQVLSGEELVSYYSQPFFQNYQIDVHGGGSGKQEYGYYFAFADGLFYAWSYQPYTESEKNILRRFRNIIALTFRRYLDLQKAEAQAREAEIELALERVRARTMAMQKSDELPDAAILLFQQVQSLGMPAWSAGYCTWSEDRSAVTLWMSSEGVLQPPFAAPTTEDELFIEMRKGAESGKELHVVEMGGDALSKHYQYMRTLPVVGEILDSIVQAGHPLPSFQVMHQAYFSKGFLLFITYQAIPEAHEIFKRFAKVFDQTYTRFLDLKKAEAQAREAQIETALERLRAHTMAMQSSSDVSDATMTMLNELEKLGVEIFRCGIGICHEHEIEIWSFGSTGKDAGAGGGGRLPTKLHPILENAYAAWLEKKEVYSCFFPGEEMKIFLSLITNRPGYNLTDPNIKFPDIWLQTYQFDDGGIFAYSIRPHDERQQEVLKRFARVFSLTFRRFKDLKTAEAQAREAQIEAALERVRSRTMAMHSSAELSDTAAEMFSQLERLGIHPWSCGFNIINLEEKTISQWVSSGDGRILPPFESPADQDVFVQFTDAFRQGESLYIEEMGGEALEAHYRYLVSIPAVSKIAEEMTAAGIRFPSFQVFNLAFFKHGYLMFITFEQVPEFHSVFHRFATVFEQTYTRFLDLQKAEAQAKESQIQLALERVRARTMAMQRSEELPEVAALLFQQVKTLGVPQFHCGFNIFEIDDKECTWYPGSADGDILPPCKIPLTEHPVFMAFNESRKRGDELFVYEKEGEFQAGHYRYMLSLPVLGEILQNMLDAGIPFPTFQIDHVANFSHGNLLFITSEHFPEMHDTFKRFAKVFDQTYTRFLDLQKAEAQAREATKQASLDRVRAVISGMRSADDLELITPLIFKELNILGIPFIRCGVFIIHEEQETIEAHLSSHGGKALGLLRLPYHASELTRQTVEAWRMGQMHLQHWSKEDFMDWTRQMMDQHQIQDSRTYQGTDTPPESLDLHFVPFTQGMLYVGAVTALAEKELDLVQSLANTFSIAYARYEDFVKLEKAKTDIEAALRELRATQSQLVQQEKLASLGQLTAGIAHEIQNPLNFVNNFSEVNLELADEINDAAAREDLNGIRALAADIKSNQEKIMEHGKRADSIVKSMLQHSRISSGENEPTDINSLCDEYFRLAYHGMRAKDKSFNAKLVTHFDASLPQINIVPQDIGRVLLNLINNAFYAANERANTQKQTVNNPSDEPMVTISTKNLGNRIEISVKDNGSGIPDHIREKIFQPFFTTKPTGQGTGLGLSLSYDIVSAHGGELKVETSEAAGTTFTILLPAN
jgi:signal transduction histidine kinase